MTYDAVLHLLGPSGGAHSVGFNLTKRTAEHGSMHGHRKLGGGKCDFRSHSPSKRRGREKNWEIL